MTLRQTLLLSAILPAALLGGALAFQYIGGLLPCSLCLQQRWPHAVAAALSLSGLVLLPRSATAAKLMGVSAPLAIMASGAIAVYHSGVERKWWQGPPCASSVDPNLPPSEYMEALKNAALINCHDITWSLFGLSMANYNALISLAGGFALLFCAIKTVRSPK